VHGADLLSYLFAAIASLGNALANVMQRKASLQKEPGTEFGGRFLLGLLRNPTWIIGFTGMVASFGFQAVALSLGQLSSVETIITLEVPLTLLVASRVFGGRLTRQEWLSIGLMTMGMIGLIGALNPRPGDEVAVDGSTYAAAGLGTALAIGVLIAVSRTSATALRTVCLGAAAGTSFGLTATLIKETVAQYDVHGFVGVFSTWQTYAAAGNGILGILLMQWALHSGPLIAAQPGFTLMDPLVSILWGVLVYNEVTRQGPWLVLAAAGGAAIIGGVIALARSPLFAPDSDALTQG
jgi:drug/metabolite transporter (DMT)-like permease